MKKTGFFILIFFVQAVQAQFNNSWIDYSKTYYKFRIGVTGMYRLTQPVLAAAGLENIPAEQFQLWHNGKEVRLYTTLPAGILSATDYIEFWGKKNDGTVDKPLYLNPDGQLCDSFSLFTDTAAYYLTVNASGANLRFIDGANNIAGNTLAAEAYFMRRVVMPFNDYSSNGPAVNVGGELLYSSAYDIGKGRTSTPVYHCCPRTSTFSGLNVYTAGPANGLSCYISAAGNTSYTRHVQMKVFNNSIYDTVLNGYAYVKREIGNLPLSYLQNTSSAQLIVQTYGSTNYDSVNDNITMGELWIRYPATFNFNGQKNFEFELPASDTGNYLVITNFNNGGIPPALYDETNGVRYSGDISVSGQVRFALPPAANAVRTFRLINENASNSINIASLTSRNFVDYSNAANRGDFLIITHPSLYNDGTGHNYVEDYRAYRASAAGGAFNAKVMDINELEDQFAFGVKKHAEAIRNLVLYSQTWAVKPKYVFIIGRGMSAAEFRSREGQSSTYQLDLVQSFGYPASDVLLTATPGTAVPLVPVGRIPAINGNEVGIYLDKIKAYEAGQASTDQTIAEKAWMKNVIHISGASDASEDAFFTGYLTGYQNIEKDTSVGANVYTFRKESSAAVIQANSGLVQQLVNSGVGYIEYFGHAAANTLAYNLDDPADFQNVNKYFFFNVMGCSAGNYYSYDTTRLINSKTISESFQFAKQRGSVGFLANTSLGVANYLDFYNTRLDSNIFRKIYGGSIGQQMQQTVSSIRAYYLSNNRSDSVSFRMTMEQNVLNGDPAMRIYTAALPDYAIEDQLVKITPDIISANDNTFTVKVNWMNIGKAMEDSMRVIIERKLPSGSIQTLYNNKILATKYMDSLLFTININAATDVGTNAIIVKLDSDQHITELSELNNTLTKNFEIFQDELDPVYPYNYSILNTAGFTYSASTANPLSGQAQYLMEIDTTQNFDSPLKRQYTASGIGGIIQFTATGMSYLDSTVYYWRTAVVPTDGKPTVWNTASFLYLTTGGSGFNQSHYFQHLASTDSSISLDSDRVFRFAEQQQNITIRTGLNPYYDHDRINMNINNNHLESYGCKIASLQFYVFDPQSLTPWLNTNVNPSSGELGSYPVCANGAQTSRYFFEFPYTSAAYRKAARDFIDSIPDGMYVSISNLGIMTNTSFIDSWKADAATLGVGNTLYDKLKSIGFTEIDSFTHNVPFIFFFKKNDNSFTPIQEVGLPTDNTTLDVTLNTRTTAGSIESPLFGPAKSWQSLHWKGKSIDPVMADKVLIQVYGVNNNGTETLLKTVLGTTTDTSLAFIDATVYPYVRLKMLASDTVYSTPEQLAFWRINGSYVPEGALAPNLLYSMADTVGQGQTIDFAIAFKNISGVPFDSLATLLKITDQSNVAHTVSLPKSKPLIAGDTISVKYTINSLNYPGNNILYLMVNPDYAQPEQYLSNNFIYKSFYVKADNNSPLMDVTFDGVHILNRDIVSARPHILIKLTDDSKYIALADTTLLSVQIQYPNGSLHPYYFSDSLLFTPANLASGTNVATIDLTPALMQDGQYELIISGKDASGNTAGSLQYKVAFNVVNKATISDLLNYPNPFTTSTAFVFTVTGVVPPQNIRIEIMTITGKIVREITSAELGPINIGRNITQFKWDGTDMYGQKLANGVYLYRVLTNLNGKSLERTDDYINANIDQYFTKGYGKMYLMR